MSTPWQALRTLDDAWVEGLQHIGGRVVRSDACFVAWLGDTQTMLIGHDATLDDDDTFAQIILHELCHHLIEGPQSWRQDDWGLDNTTDDDVHREYAALRLQAALLSTPVLRQFMQPTTDHRWFYEALGDEPLSEPVHASTDALSRAPALEGWERWNTWTHRSRIQALLGRSESVLSSRARAR